MQLLINNNNDNVNRTYLDDFLKRHSTSTLEAMERAARIIDQYENKSQD
jgi:hypothetical protein